MKNLLSIFTNEQIQKLFAWQDEQEKKLDRKKIGAIGGIYTYEITPTSLGIVVIVRNNITKDEINLTEYEDW